MRIISALALLGTLVAACAQPTKLITSDADRLLTGVSLGAPNPTDLGPHTVGRFFYGSGTDGRRVEFRDSVRVRTRSVNATPFLRGIDAKQAKKRWKYWGFDAKALPLNGRVWYPEGEGKFPLVLIVHGNHSMTEYSDPGYAYLGELLASRGMIVVSVDQNFINGNIRTENDARGWLLLKHLDAWKLMEGDSTFPLRGRVDHTRIALMGHSRGGEAVAVAAGFNQLAHYPDDARVTFAFGHALKAIVAIAPVDGQYRPADRLPPVRGVNYFVIHGSHDSDVSVFSGLRTYQRTQVTAPAQRKAALYVYRANHGQFNTVWGDNDIGPAGWTLNKKSLLSGEEQRQVGKLFISGFLELTLRDDTRYEPMFRDYRTVGSWLPRSLFVSHYVGADELVLADFEEDVDVTTGSVAGTRLEGRGLATWREWAVPMRGSARGATFETNGVVLGWAAPKTASGTDSTGSPQTSRDTASFTIQLPERLISAAGSGLEGTALVLSITDMGLKPTLLSVSDTAAPPVVAGAATKKSKDAKPKDEKKASTTAPAKKSSTARTLPADSLAVDLSVEVELADGRRAALPLSTFAALRPPLTISLYRWTRVERTFMAGVRDHEYVPQKVEIPLSRFAALLPGFSPTQLRAIRLRFDRTPTGTILLDDVGFAPLSSPSGAR